MSETDTHTYDLDSFSAGREVVHGPRELLQADALSYLSQQLADQHRGALNPAYGTTRAQEILEEASRQPGVACIHRMARGRGVIATAEPIDTAAVYEVRVFPLFEGDGERGELCAAFDHPRLSIAMREAGVRVEAWARIDSEAVQVEQERGPLAGFDAEVTARMTAPLLPGAAAPQTDEAVAEEGNAPRRGCLRESGVAVPAPPAA
jgi:hypothetical protein